MAITKRRLRPMTRLLTLARAAVPRMRGFVGPRSRIARSSRSITAKTVCAPPSDPPRTLLLRSSRADREQEKDERHRDGEAKTPRRLPIESSNVDVPSPPIVATAGIRSGSQPSGTEVLVPWPVRLMSERLVTRMSSPKSGPLLKATPPSYRPRCPSFTPRIQDHCSMASRADFEHTG